MSRHHTRAGRTRHPIKSMLGRVHGPPVFSSVPEWARRSSNPELQQELERCLKLRDGASRILPLTQNPLQQLDAIKTLFVTNEQVILCLQRLQREKVEDALSANNNPSSDSASTTGSRAQPRLRTRHHAQPGLAKLCLSDIRIPLIWRDGPLGANMQFLMQRLFPQSQSLLSAASLLAGAGDSADRSDTGEQCDGYAVFCLARLGDAIRETRLIFDIQPGTSDVEFDDKLLFDNVTEDFRLVLEIYAYPPSGCSRSLSMLSRCRTMLLDNGRRTMDPVDVAQVAGKGALSFSNYFELIGRCVASLGDLQNCVRAHALCMGSQLLLSQVMINPAAEFGRTGCDGSGASSLATSPNSTVDEQQQTRTSLTGAPYTSDLLNGSAVSGPAGQNEHGLPLFGSVCFRLVAQPHSTQKPLRTGWMWIRKLTASPAQSPACLYWCELRDRHLWAYSAHPQAKGLPSASGVQSAVTHSDLCGVTSSKPFADRSIQPVPEQDADEDEARNSTDCQSVNRTSMKEAFTQPEHPGQPISSTPQTTTIPNQFQPDAAASNHLFSPPPMNGIRTQPVDPSSRVLRLVLAITPKTLFLDSSPTLRPLSVCSPGTLNSPTVPAQMHHQPPVIRLRSPSPDRQSSIASPHSTIDPVGTALNSPPAARLYHTPKASRKMRTIKAQTHSRSLSNIKQLYALDPTNALDQFMRPRFNSDRGAHTNSGLAMTLPSRRSTRPSMEDSLPWISPPAAPTRARSIEHGLERSGSKSILNETGTTHNLSTSLEAFDTPFNYFVPKPKRFWDKVAIAQTLPRLHRMRPVRSSAVNPLSRSLDQLPTHSHAGRRTSSDTHAPDDEELGSLTDAESVLSEPAPVSLDVKELNVPPESCAGEYSLFTFRIATVSRVLSRTETTPQHQPVDAASSVEPFPLGCCSSLSEVFEFGVSKPSLQALLSSAATPEISAPVDSDDSTQYADEQSTQLWLTMFQSHVTEQTTWGPDAFSRTVQLPEAPSTARDAGTRRSLAFY